MAAVDDDVDRRVRPHRVAVQARRSEDGAVRPPADRVVEGRQRQNLDLVDDAADAVEPAHATLGVRTGRRPDDLPVERHGVAVNLVSQIVKHAVERQSHERLADALGDSLLRECAPLFRGGDGERSRQQKRARQRRESVQYVFHCQNTP